MKELCLSQLLRMKNIFNFFLVKIICETNYYAPLLKRVSTFPALQNSHSMGTWRARVHPTVGSRQAGWSPLPLQLVNLDLPIMGLPGNIQRK